MSSAGNTISSANFREELKSPQSSASKTSSRLNLHDDPESRKRIQQLTDNILDEAEKEEEKNERPQSPEEESASDDDEEEEEEIEFKSEELIVSYQNIFQL